MAKTAVHLPQGFSLASPTNTSSSADSTDSPDNPYQNSANTTVPAANSTIILPHLHTFDGLSTFDRWPLQRPTKEALVNAGFRYTHELDIVECAVCLVRIGEWDEADDPLVEHIKWSPRCTFVTSMDGSEPSSPAGSSSSSSESSSVRSTTASELSLSEPSSGSSSSTSSLSPTAQLSPSVNARGYDTCGIYDMLRVSHTSTHEQGYMPSEDAAPTGSVGAGNVAQYAHKVQKMSHPQYAQAVQRLESFRDWPVSLAQKPQELVEAGFFYTGKSDQTVCYQCGGGLKDWEATDMPWQQHAKWFPQCSFVFLQKGKEYVMEQRLATSNKGPSSASAVKDEAGQEARSETEFAESTSTAVESTSANTNATPKEEAAVADADDADPKKLSDSVLCKICYGKEVGVVFLPCGHMVACVDCAPQLDTCAVCRKRVDAHVRAFLS